MTETTISLKDINDKINNDVCYDTISKLKDDNLINEYKECNSVKNEINKLNNILEKHKIKKSIKESIINDYLL